MSDICGVIDVKLVSYYGMTAENCGNASAKGGIEEQMKVD
jgi:hypothetical protein